MKKCQDRGWTKKNRPDNLYTETHHIIPVALGGSNDPENLVELTRREHLLSHWMLTLMVDSGKDRAAMVWAFFSMTNVSEAKTGQGFHHLMAIAKRIHARTPRTREHCKNISKSLTGKKKTKEHCRNMGNSRRGMKFPSWFGEKISLAISGEKNGMYGKPSAMKGKRQTLKAKKMISDAALERKKIQCEHCLRWFKPHTHARWHGDKCKLRPGPPFAVVDGNERSLSAGIDQRVRV